MEPDLPEFRSPRFDLRKERVIQDSDPDIDEDPDVARDPDMTYSSFDQQGTVMEKQSKREVRAMYPFTVHAHDFKVGDWVKAILSEVTLSSYAGKIVDILPKANKVVVKWPHRARQEDPEWLVKLNKEESGIAITSSHTLLRESCHLAHNLVKIARGLRRDGGLSDVAAFLKMKQAFGYDHPVSWIKGAVEIAWPKRTASYSEEATMVRNLYRYALDLEDIEGVEVLPEDTPETCPWENPNPCPGPGRGMGRRPRRNMGGPPYMAAGGSVNPGDAGGKGVVPTQEQVESGCDKKSREFDVTEPEVFEDEPVGEDKIERLLRKIEEETPEQEKGLYLKPHGKESPGWGPDWGPGAGE